MNSIARLRFDVMRLAEALAERGELKPRIEQLGVRVVANARYQEGEEPAENAGELLEQLTDAVDRHALLIARINKTNTATPVGDRTLTDALAERDALQTRHRALTAAADAASGGKDRYGRQLRSELAYVSALSVRDLRRTTDDLARRIRRVDLEIQRVNWEVDLIDE